MKQKAAAAAPQVKDEPVDLAQLATPKTACEKAAIADAIKASVMFRNISDAQRELVYSCMESIPIKAGTWVIRQGEVGDRFYIVDDGTFEVRILPEDEDDVHQTGGHIVHHYKGSRDHHHHPSFGDLALMHSAPRSASVVAQTDGHLWALHRAAFRQILVQEEASKRDMHAILQRTVLQHLDPESIHTAPMIQTAVQLLEEESMGAGQNIVFQGQRADHLYIVRSGTAYSTAVTSDGNTQRQQLAKHDVFGWTNNNNNTSEEEDATAATNNSTYPATVMTVQPCKCWKLSRQALEEAGIPLTPKDDANIKKK